MRLSCTLVPLLLLLPRLAAAQALAHSPPVFEDYPIQPGSLGAKAGLILKAGMPAWNYRTVLRAAYKESPVNLANHFVVVHWGCGTTCQQLAIIDATTGQVFYPTITARQLFDSRADSKLLVVNQPEAIAAACADTTVTMGDWYCGMASYYYRWTGSRLQLIDSTFPGLGTRLGPGS